MGSKKLFSTEPSLTHQYFFIVHAVHMLFYYRDVAISSMVP